MLVFNKVDTKHGVDIEKLREKYAYFEPQFISVRTGAGVEGLMNLIAKLLV